MNEVACRHRSRSAAAQLAALLAASVALLACGRPAAVEHGFGAAAPGDCSEPREGCACAPNQPAVACVPETAAEPGFCLQGTRRCRSGRFGACEDVQRFATPAAELGALIDVDADHAQCSDCEPNCFRVGDGFDPADGALAAAFASGVQYHSSGAGLTLRPNAMLPAPPAPPSVPDGTLYLPVPQGLTASVSHGARMRPAQSDVYLLLDQSLAMAEPTQWLHDQFDAGALLPASTLCDGDPALREQGVSGALRCTIADTELGLGMFRDIPFEPYATDTSLPEAERAADARRELAFRNHARQSTDLAAVGTALTALGGVESSGDPDLAGSQIAALHSVATGEGLFTGIGRASVPIAAACDGARFGYPCFREGSRPVVVLVTGAPFHDGPDPASHPYDYDPADLAIATGTEPGVTRVGVANDGWQSAYPLPGDAAGTLALYEGSTASLGAGVSSGMVGCGADALAPNAVFSFHVNAAAGTTVPISLSTEGTAFDTALAVLTQGVRPFQQLPAASDNELFSSAYEFGDVARGHLAVDGDTSSGSLPDMSADYQSSLFGGACGANTLAPDAVYRFDVASGDPTDMTVLLGTSHPSVVSIYEDGAGALPRWPAPTTTRVANGNSDASPANVYTLPSGAGDEYVTVLGDSTGLGADYDAAALGGDACAPDSASMDAVFRIELQSRRRLRFDTEGSSFDTVLSLHDAPPLAADGAIVTHTAQSTHQNGNEDAATAFETPVQGLRQVFEGDTSSMTPDVADGLGCGMDAACGDAVYALDVAARTTLRLQVSATAEAAASGFEPAALVTRADPAGVSGRHASFALGDGFSCALSGGQVYCWGADGAGQLGNGGSAGDGDALAAVLVAGPGGVVQIGAGREHVCAVTELGAVYCWGEGSSGQLGDGALSDRYAPVQVSGVGGAGVLGGAVQVACGAQHCCALRGDGSVACWGDNAYGQLGTGARSAPIGVPTTLAGGDAFAQIALGGDHSCAIRRGDGAVLCWGKGGSGQLGDGDVSDNLAPEPVSGLGAATHVMAGAEHSCAVLASGRVYCWGRGEDGRLGQGDDVADHAEPIAVRNFDGSGLLANAEGGFAGGRAHSCVTTLEGFVQCWGDNAAHQLGNGGSDDGHLPGGVHELLDAVQVVASADHACALRAGGELWCWGDNGHGQLGSGDRSAALAPVRALAGAPQVAFGAGALDAAFTSACHSPAEPPEPGCVRRTHDGRHYFFCTDHARTFAGAAQACAAVGYGLVDVDDAGENAFVASHLDAPAWIGVKRESTPDWLDLHANLDFENEAGDPIWHTEAPGHEQCASGFCEFVPTVGWFAATAAPDLVDSDPYGSESTWAADDQPRPAWGENCVTLTPDGKWTSAACSAVPESAGCGALDLACLAGGFYDWVGGWLGDVGRLSTESRAGRLAAPHFAGGVERGYVCEQRERTTEVTLDPGRYYVTVKGSDDGDAATACSGGYRLQIDDLGSASGAMLACDDNGVAETTASAIERTLDPGDYYLVVKGKRASDQGAYQLTVRDVDAVQTDEIGCDATAGSGDVALVRFRAVPGHSYYALVKGGGPHDSGSHSLHLRDDGALDRVRLACDDDSGPDGSSRLSVPLPAGDYYAVIKGRGPEQAGEYRLMLGGAQPLQSTFTPPGYEQTVDALQASGIHVATVLSCAPGESCDDARAQAEQLSDDTGGALRVAASPADVPAEIVRAVHVVEALDRVRAELLFAPDANPGFTSAAVTAVPDPNNRCSPGDDTASFRECEPGAIASFRVSLANPAIMPVPPPPSGGAYAFTLRITGERDGDSVVQQDVPVLVVPSGGAPPGSYDHGSYFQEFDSNGCSAVTERPSWDELTFDADVLPDTRVSFYACSADRAQDLATCEHGERSSGYQRVLTISAGAGNGTPCTPASQQTDCPSGYCSPYTSVCNDLEGASCMVDADCPGTGSGRCRHGASAMQIGNTCRVDDLTASPASALPRDNHRPFMRMRVDLDSQGDGSRTPAVFFWEARYRCRSVQ